MSIGFAYEKGLGIPKDHTKAAYWYRKAAEQGDAPAQWSIGTMYFTGTTSAKDLVQAYAWWSVAARQGFKHTKYNKGIAKELMTPAQIAEAQKLSSKYWEKYVVPFQKD